MCYLTLLFTRKHCQTFRGRSPDLSIIHAFPNCFSDLVVHDRHGLTVARQFVILTRFPFNLPYGRTSKVAYFKERIRRQRYEFILSAFNYFDKNRLFCLSRISTVYTLANDVLLKFAFDRA